MPVHDSDTTSTLIHAPWVGELLTLLWQHGYSRARRKAIVMWAVEWNTLQCCPHLLSESDRDEAESVIPDDPSWDRDLWNGIGYATTEAH